MGGILSRDDSEGRTITNLDLHKMARILLEKCEHIIKTASYPYIALDISSHKIFNDLVAFYNQSDRLSFSEDFITSLEPTDSSAASNRRTVIKKLGESDGMTRQMSLERALNINVKNSPSFSKRGDGTFDISMDAETTDDYSKSAVVNLTHKKSVRRYH